MIIDFNGGNGGGSYTLPKASATTLGGVKIGTGISIDSDGKISASGGGSEVVWLDSLTTEQAVAEYNYIMTAYNSGTAVNKIYQWRNDTDFIFTSTSIRIQTDYAVTFLSMKGYSNEDNRIEGYCIEASGNKYGFEWTFNGGYQTETYNISNLITEGTDAIASFYSNITSRISGGSDDFRFIWKESSDDNYFKAEQAYYRWQKNDNWLVIVFPVQDSGTQMRYVRLGAAGNYENEVG